MACGKCQQCLRRLLPPDARRRGQRRIAVDDVLFRLALQQLRQPDVFRRHAAPRLVADQPLLVHLHRAPRRRLRAGPARRASTPGAVRRAIRSAPASRAFLPLYGDDLALGLLAVEQSKMGGFHIVCQLLFQQKRGHLQRRFTQARR